MSESGECYFCPQAGERRLGEELTLCEVCRWDLNGEFEEEGEDE